MALVVDASVALKWVLQEPDSLLAEALLSSAEERFVPELWLHPAANVLWVQVHRRTTPQRRSWTAVEARTVRDLLQEAVSPTPTHDMGCTPLRSTSGSPSIIRRTTVFLQYVQRTRRRSGYAGSAAPSDVNPLRVIRCRAARGKGLARIAIGATTAAMATINVSLPDSLKSFVDDQVVARGYGTASEYVRELIRRDQDRQHLRSLLLGRAASPATEPADDAYFEALRARVRGTA